MVMKKLIRYSDNSILQRAAVLAATLTFALGASQAKASRLVGVDVYEGNGTVNWSSVAGDGVTFAFTKATQGNYYEDPNMVVNLTNGKGAGLVMGVYDLADPATCSPSTEANYFWNYVQSYILADGKTIMPVLDFEPQTLGETTYTGASSWSDWVNQWCTDVQNLAAANGLTVTPIIYISAGYTSTYLTSANSWTYNWIADYNNESEQTGSPWGGGSYYQPWGSGVWDFWQATSSGTVTGISGAVDVDVLNGTSLTPYIVTSSFNKPAAIAPPVWNLRNTLTTGAATTSFSYGTSSDTMFVMGDWDGNGSMTPGLIRTNSSGQLVWYLRNENSSGGADITFTYGRAGNIPIVGDWDGNGTWTPGVVTTNTSGQYVWELRNENNSGGADITFTYGRVAGGTPIVGDWDGNGTFTPGVVTGNTWNLRNENSSGGADISFGYGNGTTDIPIAGDWDGNGTWTPGVIHNGNTWELRNENSSGAADITFGYGASGNFFQVWR
jgi:GH25 family lysozyme M1 (1,4-beta-N-acetylmuramidase)